MWSLSLWLTRAVSPLLSQARALAKKAALAAGEDMGGGAGRGKLQRSASDVSDGSAVTRGGDADNKGKEEGEEKKAAGFKVREAQG